MTMAACTYLMSQNHAGACPADLNDDRVLNFFDVTIFIEGFATQSDDADFNGDGLLNFFDVSSFLETYLAGCP